MKILVLGGTVFLGRHLVEAARSRGHKVTIFHRGRTNPGLFSSVEVLLGDRGGAMDALSGREWDAVLDTSGFVPRVVRASARKLAPAVGHYTFISSGSVYPASVTAPDESSPVETVEDESSENISESYGALKALCERAIEESLPGRMLAVRAGLLVGPHDPTERFTYWPRRIAQGGEVLAPGRPERPVQLIDARDLAEWIVQMAEARRTGVYNATGPSSRLSMGELLDACQFGTIEWGPEGSTGPAQSDTATRKEEAWGCIGVSENQVDLERDGVVSRAGMNRRGIEPHAESERRGIERGDAELRPESEDPCVEGGAANERSAAGTRGALVWVDEPFLLEQGVEPWMELPLWLPESMNSLMTMNIRRALDAGLTFRPLAETARDTLVWDRSRPAEDRGKPARLSTGLRKQTGLTAQKEAALLQAWRSRER